MADRTPPRVDAPTSRFFAVSWVERGLLLALWDGLSWAGATALYLLLRAQPTDTALMTNLVLYALLAIIVQWIAGFLLRVYLGGTKIGSYEDATMAATSALIPAVLISTVAFCFFHPFSRLAAVVIPSLSILSIEVGRWTWRKLRRGSHKNRKDGEPVLIYGAGVLGAHIARLNDQSRIPPFHIIGYLDDAPANRYLRIRGRQVLGRGKDLETLLTTTDVRTVILAITNLPADFVRHLAERCRQNNVRLVIVPDVSEMVGAGMTLSQLRDVDTSELLGRPEIKTDLETVSGYLNGVVVMITGAGGSIGSELARHVHRLGPKKLVLLDRDETLLHSVQLSIYNKGLLDTNDIVLCDIRDEEALDKIFELHKPEVVFHAAALKHLPMLEQYPEEGWKTNVLGTRNVLRCADRHGTARLVNISTDKAADPINVLGKTKRIAEQLTASYASKPNRTYLSVRFGNVLGSRGSVLHSIRAQIRAGGPVTITHPKVTRYFMTIPEACQLVLHAGGIGQAGDVMVLDMGQPVLIKDMAERLINESGLPIEIIFTGLRQGEKLDEELFGSAELGDTRQSSHPLISCVAVPPLDPERIGHNQAAHDAILAGDHTIKD